MLELLANNILWWHWIIFGLIMLIVELFTNIFIMLGLGISAIIVGTIDLIFVLSLNEELLIWIISSIVIIIFLIKFFRKSKTDKSGQSNYAIGVKGIIEEPIKAYGRGKVRFNTPILGSRIWNATADEDLDSEIRVEIIEVRGQLIKVQKI